MIALSRKPMLWGLVAAGIASAAVGISACGGAAGYDSTPVTPSPTPTILTHCQIVFENDGSNPGKTDLFIIDAPIADWVTGVLSFDVTVGHEVAALVYDEFDSSTTPPTYLSRAIATNGAFAVTADQGPQTGADISYSDSSGQILFGIDGAGVVGNVVGSGGAGSFTGKWSDPANPTLPMPGTGYVNVSYPGIDPTVGTKTRYALCYSASSSFAPQSIADRVEAVLEDRASAVLEDRASAVLEDRASAVSKESR